MTRRGALLGAVLLVPLLAGCSGSEPVLDPDLPAVEVRAVPGPSYAEQVLLGRQHLLIHAPGHTTRVEQGWEAVWRSDGSVVVLGAAWARILDPTTGRWLSDRVRLGGEYGVTPEAVTTLGARAGRVLVYDAALASSRTIAIPESAAESDQIDGPDAEFQLHGRPYTLGGVTFVEWGVNSEDDTRTDHGLFRVEGERITQALRNQPLVRLWPSLDGSALLAIMQDNGEDEDCGGCQVEQKVVELDPDTGGIAADYGTPPGYTRDWRISSLDKVGRVLAVQYVVREGESGGRYQTWTYDGSWHHQAASGETRTRFQAGGTLTWAGDTGEPNQPYDLVWHPATGPAEVIRERATPCPTDDTDWTACPTVSLPGSLLPLD